MMQKVIKNLLAHDDKKILPPVYRGHVKDETDADYIGCRLICIKKQKD